MVTILAIYCFIIKYVLIRLNKQGAYFTNVNNINNLYINVINNYTIKMFLFYVNMI